jgi:hypothetical protein
VSILCCWALTPSAHIKLIAASKTVRLIARLSNPNFRFAPTVAVPVESSTNP